MPEDQRDPGVGDGQRQPLHRPHTAPKEHDAQQQHEAGREEQDQALEAGTDVLQADQVEHAGGVIAHEAERGDAQHVAHAQTRQVAPGPHRHDQKQRAGGQHAQGDHVHRVEPVLVQQLDADDFGRQQDGAAGGQRHAAAMTHADRARNQNGRVHGKGGVTTVCPCGAVSLIDARAPDRSGWTRRQEPGARAS